jgi:hypothetical protein
MQEIINEKVSVITVYDRNRGLVFPQKIKWQGRIYKPEKLGYYYKFREGRKLIHIFSVCNNSMHFKLRFDSENLHWTLEEVSDGIAN